MWRILGIEPTRDAKAIKSAYARLVKKYNPEEYPEEFKRLHDAYKQAMIYAKTGEIYISSLGITIKPSEKEKKSSDEITNKSSEFIFENADADGRKSENRESAEKDKSFDFGKLGEGTGTNDFRNRETVKKEEFDFANIGKKGKSEKTEKPPRTEYDFGKVKTDKIGNEKKLTYTERRFGTIMEMRRLIADKQKKNDRDAWLDFFTGEDFKMFVSDIIFRKAASEDISCSQFTHETACVIAAAFGGSSTVKPANSRVSGKWSVVISAGTSKDSPLPESERKEDPASENELAKKAILLAAAKLMRIFFK